MNTRIVLAGALALGALLTAAPAQAFHPFCRARCCGLGCLHHASANDVAAGYAESNPWHGGYYHTMWGQPVALVVPPSVEYQVNYSWGVPATRVEPIYHQFNRQYPGPYYGGNGFQATPKWPSDTTQFGVYYARGPY